MNNLTISNLSHVMGSKKKTCSSFMKKNPDWNITEVKKKTGINYIYESNERENVLELSYKSSYKTLKKFNRKKIDSIVVVTQTAKNKLPSISCMLQEKLKLNKNVFALDINLGCSGFIYALATLHSFFLSKILRNTLLICSDTYTKFLEDNDRTCRTVFSDAASSCVVSARSSKISPVFNFFTDGSGAGDLIEKNNYIKMNGSGVFLFTTKVIPTLFKNLLKKNNLEIKDIDHFIFHQASKLVLDKLKLELKIPSNKFHINYDKIGNTTSASIPIVLEKLVKNKVFKKNDNLMLVGFGVGLSAACCILRWK
jgi:3-oxoacyl-[acyl-carrier-protein] synthase-3